MAAMLMGALSSSTLSRRYYARWWHRIPAKRQNRSLSGDTIAPFVFPTGEGQDFRIR